MPVTQRQIDQQLGCRKATAILTKRERDLRILVKDALDKYTQLNKELEEVERCVLLLNPDDDYNWKPAGSPRKQITPILQPGEVFFS